MARMEVRDLILRAVCRDCERSVVLNPNDLARSGKQRGGIAQTVAMIEGRLYCKACNPRPNREPYRNCMLELTTKYEQSSAPPNSGDRQKSRGHPCPACHQEYGGSRRDHGYGVCRRCHQGLNRPLR